MKKTGYFFNSDSRPFNKAVNVPQAMQGCIELDKEELTELKRLLDKALIRMEDKR